MIIERCSLNVVKDMCSKYHGYGDCGKLSVENYCVIEDGEPVAAFMWLPPAPGSAKSVCPEHPAGVLSLSRMVAVPKSERKLKHISKPLMVQMKKLIDRTRWPVLVTYSDSSQGHTGYVYKCSGWDNCGTRLTKIYDNDVGVRSSSYTSGKTDFTGLSFKGFAEITRWEHWACERGNALEHSLSAGWYRSPTGKKYRSGNDAFVWKR